MNGGLSITERLNQSGNVDPLSPAPVEQLPPEAPIAPETPPSQWQMEGDLFSDEAGRNLSERMGVRTIASIGNLAAKSSEVTLKDEAVLPAESPTQLPKRVDPYLRTEGVGPSAPTTEAQRRAKQQETDAYFGYSNEPNPMGGTPRSASVNMPATRVSGSRRPTASAEAIAADDDHFARMNGAA